MEICAEKQQFERAAKFRDSYFNIKQSMERQKVIDENLTSNQDLIGFIEDELRFVAVLMEIRDGRMLDKKNFELSKNETDSINEAILSFIKNYYLLKTSDFPKEVLIPVEADEKEIELIEQWLSQKRGTKVTVTMPKLGKKKELTELAQKNASAYLAELKLKDLTQIQADWNEVGSYIKEKLLMKTFPHRVECFDISHSQGTNTVASMVVFVDGKPSKKDYRKFKIKSTEGKPDDFLSMKEVISRRYKDKENMPDLIIVDGGKGQLSSACNILKELDIKGQAICGLAKRLEEVFLPKKSIPIIFPSTSSALYFFQRIRDEAHRFAITFHRSLREKNALVSMLDEVKYIGKERKKVLYEKFKDIGRIKKAKKKDLEELLGQKAAKSLWDKLHHNSV
jgi:excinuclease ABC subunit C